MQISNKEGNETWLDNPGELILLMICRYQYGPRDIDASIQIYMGKAYQEIRNDKFTTWCQCCGDFGEIILVIV